MSVHFRPHISVRVNWSDMTKLVSQWLPQRIQHPWPNQRFAVVFAFDASGEGFFP
jgi:hypothetical protein